MPRRQVAVGDPQLDKGVLWNGTTTFGVASGVPKKTSATVRRRFNDFKAVAKPGREPRFH